MQDDAHDLTPFGDLAFPDDLWTVQHDLHGLQVTARRVLSEEDRRNLQQLVPTEVQAWCLSRIAEHQNHNRILREQHGVCAARDVVSQNKSHIRALRSAYNDAASINRHLPPEVLMEVFSRVHPAVMPQPLVPLLRVCRYWRRLVLKTPQFWANLLSLPTWKMQNPKHDLGRFRAAVARSSPATLDLSIPYSSQALVDILAPHVSRISSFKVGPTLYGIEEMAGVLEQRMARLKHLTILRSCRYTKMAPFAFDFPQIQSLELERTHFYTPISPYPSLCHLKLRRSTILPSPDAASSAPTLCAMRNALEFFPNLEILSMVYSLMDDGPHDGQRPTPKTVHLSRLRHLEIEDKAPYISSFLSHLHFPQTTTLVLDSPGNVLDYWRHGAISVPLFPILNSFPASPAAELSLYLNFRGMPRKDRWLARWNTNGAGVRPIHVALRGSAWDCNVVTHFTREFAMAFAPAPAHGVTSLAVVGTCQSVTWEYWQVILRNLPGLRSFAWARVSAAKFDGLVKTLQGKRWPDARLEDGFPCVSLEELVLGWDLLKVYDIRGPEQEEREWCSLLQDGGRCDKSWPDLESPLAASLSQFCDALRECLAERAGHCEPIRKLSVSLHWDGDRQDHSILEGWQAALVEHRLRRTLGHLVGDIAVDSDAN